MAVKKDIELENATAVNCSCDLELDRWPWIRSWLEDFQGVSAYWNELQKLRA